ncbi:MAG: ATP-binding protein [Myxococcota bacterium]
MTLSLRARLFFVIVGFTALVGMLAGGWLEVRLRGQLVDQIEHQLQQHTGTLAVHLQATGWSRIDDEVDAMAEAAQVRLTVIGSDGQVLGDSQLDGPELASMDNHQDRPEIRQSTTESLGVSTRHSQTLNSDLLYVARRVDSGANRVHIIRAATPLSEIQTAIWTLRLNLLLTLGLAVLAGVATSAMVSRWVERTLERLVEQADALAVENEGSTEDLPPAPPAPAAGRGGVQAMSLRLEEALKALAGERDRREAVLQGVTDGVFAIDSDLVITLANPAAKLLLGAKPVGRSLSELSASRKLTKLARSAIKKNRAKTKEVPWEGPPRRELEAVIAPLPSGEGAVIVIHDLTEVRALERVRTDFVTNVSHELRTPVAIIAANAETLVDGAINDPEFAGTFVEAVHRQALRLSHLVDDLLSLSRIESGRLPTAPALLNVGRVAAQVAATATELRKTGSPITVDVPDGLEVWADRSALEHALGNLAENAVKYVPPQASIEIRAGEDDDRVWIEVADEGQGIPAEHLDRIFERFYRVDKGRARDVGGTGLGLAIVRHLTETLGGTVEARANEPSGVIFRLDLPGPADGEG